MPLSLTCDCGARFEVEDSLAGQTVSCPECQTALKAPAARRPVVRTSNFALASFLLAIIGAFTVVGTIAAAILGLIGVANILRDRERQAGLGFAVTGVVLGVAFTALTLFGFSQLEFFFRTARKEQLTSQLDKKVDVNAVVEMKEDGFSVTKPPAWGKGVKDFQDPSTQLLLQGDPSLLLVQPALDAFVAVEVEPDPHVSDLDSYLLNRIKPDQGAADPSLGADAKEKEKEEESLLRVQSRKKVASNDLGNGVHELTAEIKLNATGPTMPRDWTMLIRTKTGGGKLFIVRGFTETKRFGDPEHVRDELLKVMDTFKVGP